MRDSLAAVVIQPLEASAAVILSKDIQEEVRPTGQKEGIKEDKLEAVFKARGKTTKDKLNKIDKTELPELSAEEVLKIGFSTVPTI